MCSFCVWADIFYKLCVQLIFHLQTCDPPVLPPLHELFQDSCSAISSRPIHMGKDIDWHKLEVSLLSILCGPQALEAPCTAKVTERHASTAQGLAN